MLPVRIPVAAQGMVVAVSTVERSLHALISPGNPMLSTDVDILKTAEAWRCKGRGVAIATVVETWGSAPRPVGSHLVIDEDTNFLGSVSGGCVEGAVITEALDVIADGKPRMLEFGVADETAWQVGLSCGGRIKVYVERVD
jgi:xanthine/CO dehydrogenase XdhC/CoxF family maturation factor